MSLNYEEINNAELNIEEPETEEPETEEPSALDILEGKVKKCEEGLIDAMKGVDKDFKADRTRISELEGKLKDLERVVGGLVGDVEPTPYDKVHPTASKPDVIYDGYKVSDGTKTILDVNEDRIRRRRSTAHLNDFEIFKTWVWKTKNKDGKIEYVELTEEETEEAMAQGLI